MANKPPRKTAAKMKTYKGTRDQSGTCKVTVDGKPLNPRFDLWNHSPTGFEWGYHGSGPAQLALALCADVHPPEVAVYIHQTFKSAVVAHLPLGGWTLTENQILHPIAADLEVVMDFLPLDMVAAF